jgi:Ca2+-binding EF-hand superfamily protein
MKRMAAPLALACGFLLALAYGQEQSKTDEAPAGRAPDVQDMIFLSDSRPLLIRMHIRIDGKPFRVAWDEFMSALFQYLDADGDGVLSQVEIDRAPPPLLLLQLVRGNYFDLTQQPANSRPQPELQLTLVPGKVTRDGMASYYRLAGLSPFMPFVQDRSAEGDELTDALFRELDRDRDGKLSKDELLGAEAILRKLDLNDDEIITPEELVPVVTDPNVPQQPRNRVQIMADKGSFLLVSPEDTSGRLAFAIMSRYDKDQSEKLSRTEFPVDKKLFDQIDADQDGELDTQELGKYLSLAPVDLEINVSLGQLPENGMPIDLPQANGPASPLMTATRRLDNAALSLTVGDAAIDLRASAGVPVYLDSVRQFLTYQFQLVDTAKRGFINRKQADQNPNLSGLFTSADRDGDGKLYLKELTTYLDLLSKAVSSCSVAMVTDNGRGLFDLLNTQRDGRLKLREVSQAWARLAPMGKDDQIDRADLPHQFQLFVSQGQPAAFALGAMAPGGAMDRRPTATARGPLWFRKMDRNGDGFVSAREFLGSKEDFQRIDADGDGLISPEEAEREDARLKKK